MRGAILRILVVGELRGVIFKPDYDFWGVGGALGGFSGGLKISPGGPLGKDLKRKINNIYTNIYKNVCPPNVVGAPKIRGEGDGGLEKYVMSCGREA